MPSRIVEELIARVATLEVKVDHILGLQKWGLWMFGMVVVGVFVQIFVAMVGK